MLGGCGTYKAINGSVTRWVPFNRSQRTSGVAGRIDSPAASERATAWPNRAQNSAASMGTMKGSAWTGVNGEEGDGGRDIEEDEDSSEWGDDP